MKVYNSFFVWLISILVNFNTSVSKCSLHQLETLDENVPASSCLPPPETPTESMEFLARSWSLSATELSKALHNNDASTSSAMEMRLLRNSDQFNTKGFTASKDSVRTFTLKFSQCNAAWKLETMHLIMSLCSCYFYCIGYELLIRVIWAVI